MSDGVPASRFHAAYAGDPPPWEIARPQREIVRAWKDGLIGGRVLDSGCGTGENALFLAEKGLEVVAYDAVPAAVEAARKKGATRGTSAIFRVGDALDASSVRGPFDTVIDSGVFHTFDDDQRRIYAANLARWTVRGGRLCVLCFSEHAKGEGGPRRVTQAELAVALAGGFVIEDVRAGIYETRVPLFGPEGAPAWFAVLRRL